MWNDKRVKRFLKRDGAIRFTLKAEFVRQNPAGKWEQTIPEEVKVVELFGTRMYNSVQPHSMEWIKRMVKRMPLKLIKKIERKL